MNVLLIVLLVLLIVGGLPHWGHSWGYFPSGGLGVLLVVLLVLLVTGRL